MAVRDSAGVRIVESHAPAAGERFWRVDDDPALEVGVAEGAPEYQLSRVRGAVRLPDGGVVVADGDSHELRYYGPDGRFRHRAGGPGGGPGEFASLDALLPYRADSVAAWDGRQQRLSVFAPDGALGRTVTIQGLASVSAWLRGTLPDGSLLLQPTASAEDYLRMTAGEGRDTVAYLRFTAEGTFADSVARRAAREYVVTRSATVISQRSLLFGRDSYLAAAGDRVFVGESDRFQVEVLDPAGRARMIVRRPDEPRPVSRGELARARAAADESRARNREQVARIAGSALPGGGGDEIPARSTLPAFDRLLADSEGFLWVRDYLVSRDDHPRWSVFGPDGRWVARVEAPAGLEVYQVGPDWILGRGVDDLEVEYVRLLRLHRGG